MDINFRVFVYGNSAGASTKGNGKLCLVDRHATWPSFQRSAARALLGDAFSEESTQTDSMKVFFLPNGEEITPEVGLSVVHDKDALCVSVEGHPFHNAQTIVAPRDDTQAQYSVIEEGSVTVESMSHHQHTSFMSKGIAISSATLRFDQTHTPSPRAMTSAVERNRRNSLSVQGHRQKIRRLNVNDNEKTKGIVSLIKVEKSGEIMTKKAADMWKKKAVGKTAYQVADSGGEGEVPRRSTAPSSQGGVLEGKVGDANGKEPDAPPLLICTKSDAIEGGVKENHRKSESSGSIRWKKVKAVGIVKRLSGSLGKTAPSENMKADLPKKDDGIHDGLADEDLSKYIQNICNVYKYIDTRPQRLEMNAASRSMVLMPESTAMTFWSVMVLALVMFYAIAVPVRVAWEPKLSPAASIFDTTSDVIFLIDIVINFRTAYKQKGVLVVDPKQIAWKYFSSWFFIDFSASIPIGWFTPEGNGASKANKLFRLLRILKLARIFRIGRYFYQFEQLFRLNPSIVRFMKGAGGLFFVWHLVGCTYWYIVHSSIYEGYEDCQVEQFNLVTNEMEVLPSRCFVNACAFAGTCLSEYNDEDFFESIPPEYHLPDKWLPNPNMATVSLNNQYWFAYFWAVQVTTGFGDDVEPKTILEVVFTILITVWGLTLLAIIIGAASSALSNIDSVKSQHKERLDHVSDNLRHWKVPMFFQKIVKDFYEHTWSSPNDSTKVLRDLPDTLRMRLRIVIYQDLVNKVPIFKSLGTSQFIEVLQALSFRTYLPGEYVVMEEEVGSEMYFIERGQIDVYAPVPKGAEETDAHHIIIATLSEGNFFGEAALLDNVPRKASCRASSFCDVLVLKSSDFHRVKGKSAAFNRKITQAHDMRSQDLVKALRMIKEGGGNSGNNSPGN